MERKRRRAQLSTTPKNEVNVSKLMPEIASIFESAQHNISCHEKCIKLMHKIYDKTDEDKFFNLFVDCLEVPLQIGEKSIKVERTLDFAAKFCTSFGEVTQVVDDDEEESVLHPFTTKIFHYALKYHSSIMPGFRYRICQFINKILSLKAELEDSLCDHILRAMLERLQDPKYKVRTQAIIALFRLQNPVDAKDPVTRAYLFHLESDPSPQVRRAVINNLARSARAFLPIMARIQDVDRKVRRDAYNFLGMFSSKNFKIIQRMTLLKVGLTDREELVKNCVKKTLIPKWFVHYERSYFDFLKAIRVDVDVETIKDSIEVSHLLLNVFFTENSANEIIEVLTLDEQKVLPYESLDHEHVIYWSYLAQFFHKQGTVAEDFLDEILPELTIFCNYIKGFVDKSHGDKRDPLEENIYQSILQQLFEMIEYFDLSDEVGRNNLNTLITDFLLKEFLSAPVIDSIMKIYEMLVPQPKQRIENVIQIIADIVEPIFQEEVELSENEKRRMEVKIHELRFKINCLNDDEEKAVSEKNYDEAAKITKELNEVRRKLSELTTQPAPVVEVRKKTEDEDRVEKALTIVAAMFQTDTIRELTPELRMLQRNLIADYCQKSKVPPKIEAVALKCLANCAYLDENLAIAVMPKFFYRAMVYQYNLPMNKEVVKTALAAIFDILALYDLTKFEEAENERTKPVPKNRRSAGGNKTKRALYDVSNFDDSDDSDQEITTLKDDLEHLPLNNSANDMISCLLSFLDDELVEFRTIAATGLVRLLVCGKFKSTDVLKRLILSWFNPVTENDVKLRQVLGIMINKFARQTPGSQEEFEKAFLPVVRTLLDAPNTSPLSQVDIDAAINFMLTYTQPGFNASDTMNVHNHLAIIICEEILKSKPDSRDKMYLMKCLPNLVVNEDDRNLLNDLHNLCHQIIESTKNKNYIRCVEKFLKQIQPSNTDVENQDTNVNELIEAEDEAMSANNTNAGVETRRNSLLDKSLRVALVRFDDLAINEDGVHIDDSSPNQSLRSNSSITSRRSQGSNASRREQLIISTSEESEDEIESSSSSSEESEVEFKRPLMRTSLRKRTSKY